MLIAGGMSHHSARKLTGKLNYSEVITECRSDIAKERNERARSVHHQRRNRPFLLNRDWGGHITAVQYVQGLSKVK
jgi:hypothetical protein